MRCHDTSWLSLPCVQVQTYLQKMKAFYSLNVVCFLFIDSINVDYYKADSLWCRQYRSEQNRLGATQHQVSNSVREINRSSQIIVSAVNVYVNVSKNQRTCEIGRADLCAEKSRHGNTGEKRDNQWLRPCAGRRRIPSTGGVIVLWKGSRSEQWVQMLLNL